MEFKHPKYYKELRKLRNKLDQAISPKKLSHSEERSPDPGPKPQASSSKPQAPSESSIKPQAPRSENHGKVSRHLNQGAQCR